MSEKRALAEPEKIVKTRKQLLIVGVICIAAVIFALWAATLPDRLRRNREGTPGAFSGMLQDADAQTGGWKALWQQIKRSQ